MKRIKRSVLGILIGVLPASLVGAMLWYFTRGVETHELPGSAAYGTAIVISWWMGVAVGVMSAVLISRRAWVGVIVGFLSSVPLMIVDMLNAGSAESLQSLGSADGWIGAIMAVLLPAAIGLLFSTKRLEHTRQLGGSEYRMPG
ncbi:MAG: hypothetical protein PF636_06370 [Actinomycetota bacterium]|nr:hypothetical protein [Actinomycetota bacterium]